MPDPGSLIPVTPQTHRRVESLDLAIKRRGRGLPAPQRCRRVAGQDWTVKGWRPYRLEWWCRLTLRRRWRDRLFLRTRRSQLQGLKGSVMRTSNACEVFPGDADHAENIFGRWTTLTDYPPTQGSPVDSKHFGRRTLPAARPKHAPSHRLDMVDSAAWRGLFYVVRCGHFVCPDQVHNHLRPIIYHDSHFACQLLCP
jgi:hypothetical protein